MWSLEVPAALLLLPLLPLLLYRAHFNRHRGGKLRFAFKLYGSTDFRPGIGRGRVVMILSRIGFAIHIKIKIHSSS